MRSTRKLPIMAFAALSALMLVTPMALGATDEAAQPVSVSYSTELEVRPDGSAEGIWFCRFLLRDLTTDEVLLVPSIVFPEGESAQVMSSLPDGTEFELEVRVEEGGKTASWTTEVRHEGRLLSAQKGSVQLAAP